jgi:hypothetical protein
MGLLIKAAAVRNTAVSSSGALEPGGPGISGLLEAFQKRSVPFHCIVLRSLPPRRASDLAAYFGLARALPDGNCLVLFPGDMDRELIAHRLSRSAGAVVISLFTSVSAVDALEALGPHLQ